MTTTQINKKNITDIFKDILKSLSEKEKEVIEKRIWLNWEKQTLQNIWNSFSPNITRERVRQIEDSWVKKIGRIIKATILVEVQDYAKKIMADKRGGIISYIEATTGQDKIVSYRYIPEWDMWVIPGINKDDYLDDVKADFFYFIVLLGIILIIAQILISLNIYRTVNKGITTFMDYFEEFLNLITYKQNKITKIETKNDSEFSKMINEINAVVDEFDVKYKEDTKVIGEIVLTMDKMEQGIFRCRIKSKTRNPMISTLRNTINQSLDSLEHSMKDLERVTQAYANNNFREVVDISPRMKGRLLSVMTGVNTLGNALGNVAKQNLENGQTLEHNATTMKGAMQNLAAKANEQAKET